MTINLTRLTILAIICFIGLLSLHADETEPPYLYYYSRMLGGIIVERADGTDSHHIGANVIPSGMTGISGSGWSPSGKYFAGYGTYYGGFSYSTTTGFVIDSSGESKTPYVYNLNATTWMEWTPTGEDIIFIHGATRSGGDYMSTHFLVVDATSGELLSDYGTVINPVYRGYIDWDVDNEQVIVYYSTDLLPEFTRYKVTLKFDGNVKKDVVDLDDYPRSPQPDTYVSGDLDKGTHVSPSGQYETVGTHPAILTNTETNEQLELPIHSQETKCRGYTWSNSENYLIVKGGTLVSGGGCSSVVLAVTDSRGQLWREIGRCSWEELCANWLPEQVDVEDLPPREDTPVQLEPIRIDKETPKFGIYQGETDWFMFCISDRTAHIRDHEETQIYYRLTSFECPYNPGDDYKTYGLEIHVVEEPKNNLLATYHGYFEGFVTIWIQQDDMTYRPALRLNTDGYQLEFTDDGQYLRARNVSGWKVYAVSDILKRIAQAN